LKVVSELAKYTNAPGIGTTIAQNHVILRGHGTTPQYQSLLRRQNRIVSIDSIDYTIEPTFAASTSETVTAKLRAQLDAAIAVIPHCHATNSSRGEVF